MVDYVKYGLIVLVLSAVYMAGYYRAETRGELAIKSLKLNHALAILAAQEKEKAKYEKDIANLLSDLDDLRSEHNDRLFELNQFRSAGRDLQACLSERSALAELSVRGESLLKRSVQYLEATVHQK